MKNLFTLAAAGLLALATVLPGRAQPGGPPTAVNFASGQGVPFGLVLDGQLLAAPVVREMHLDYLAPGRHWADFSVLTAAGTQRFRVAVWWLRPGMEMNFVLIASRPTRAAAAKQGARTAPRLPYMGPGPRRL